ncbi:nuclear transport factor 2 family protein [Bacteroidota bacterium]
MQKLNYLFVLTFAVSIFSNGFCQTVETEKEAIRRVINEAYVNGAFNDKTNEAMLKGFHETFTIQAGHDEWRITTLKSWMDELSGWKKENAENERGRDWSITASAEINVLAVHGDGAVAGVELSFGPEQSFTVFLSLHKFSEGWKIVNLLGTHEIDE